MRIVGLPLAAMLAGTVGIGGSAALGAMADKFSITAQEHAACDGDAVNLCAWTYPDEDKLLACMKSNRDKLSPLCAATLMAGLRRRHLPL